MLILIISIFVLFFDQLSKHYIQINMEPGATLPLIKNVFHISYVLNPGAAFGIMQNQTVFFATVAIALFIAAIYFYPRIPAGHRLLRIGIGLQVGGAAGNFIDRIKTGYVIDFLDFRYWPVFNLADIAIVVGVALIIYDLLYLSAKEVR